MITGLLDAGGLSVLRPSSEIVDRGGTAAAIDGGQVMRQTDASAVPPAGLPRRYTLELDAGRDELAAILNVWRECICGALPVEWRHWRDDPAPPADALSYRLVGVTVGERRVASARVTVVLERWEVGS